MAITKELESGAVEFIKDTYEEIVIDMKNEVEKLKKEIKKLKEKK